MFHNKVQQRCIQWQEIRDEHLEFIQGGMRPTPCPVPGDWPSQNPAWNSYSGSGGNGTNPTARIVWGALKDAFKSEVVYQTVKSGVEAGKACKDWMNTHLHESSKPVKDRTHRWLN